VRVEKIFPVSDKKDTGKKPQTTLKKKPKKSFTEVLQELIKKELDKV